MKQDYLSRRWRILAVDDSRLNRAIIKKVLSDLNMEVFEACDGQEALDMLSKGSYDLILVDIIMPNLDGFGFLSKFKNMESQEFIPAILMTGSDDLNSKIKGLRIGADDFLLKPLNEKELAARVLSLLRLKSAYSEIYEKNRLIEKEMEAAKRVQEYIIPKEFGAVRYPSVTGRYLPIEDIGGDFYDCYRVSESITGFLIADVTGHGIPAALVMSMAKMLFSVYSLQMISPRLLFEKINCEIKSLLLDSQYITSFYAIYDRDSNLLTLSNAGHVMPLFYRASKKQVLALDTNGYFIGISDQTRYEEKKLKVEKNDRLIMFTDGITEIKRSDGEEYGEKRFAAFIKNNHKLKGGDFCDALLDEINRYSPLEYRNDDIAFLNIEF